MMVGLSILIVIQVSFVLVVAIFEATHANYRRLFLALWAVIGLLVLRKLPISAWIVWVRGSMKL